MSTPTPSSSEVIPPKVASRLWLKISVSLVLAGLLGWALHIWGVALLHRIDSSFSYEADVLSLDNFYDEELQQFLGEARSVTTFVYNFAEKASGGTVVSNVFDVRTVQGEPIFTVERAYGVDPITWQHISGVGDKDRSGYLFAPRHLKRGESYAYWHVNYDQELELLYEGEEMIHGLKTYRYNTSFKTDQTDNLTHLPGVPDERGINLDVSLTVWVEPVSGWLVHYQDNAVAYYYDRVTGERLHPWNKFSNRYRTSSIAEHARIASQRKLTVMTLEFVAPLALALVAITFFCWRTRRRVALGVAIVGGVVCLALLVWFALPLFGTRSDDFVVGIARWAPRDNVAYDDNIRGFIDGLAEAGFIEGQNIQYQLEVANSDTNEQARIASQFSEQDVDLIFSQTTPGTLVLKEHIPHRPIVFSIVTYPVEAGLVASLQRSDNNLVGTRNWVPAEEQLAKFLELVPGANRIGFVHRAGEINSAIQFEEMQQAARAVEVELVDITAGSSSELPDALEAARDQIDSVFSACDTLVGISEEIILAFLRQHELPSFTCNQSGVFKGDLIGVVADFYEIGKLAGENAAQVLGGVSPAALETRTVARPLLYINATRAEELGLTIPQALQAQVRELIR